MRGGRAEGLSVSAIALSMAMFGNSACAHISVTEEHLDEPVRAYTEHEQSGQKYFVGVSAVPTEDGEGAIVAVDVSQGRLCRTVEHRLVDRTTITVREVESGDWRYAGYTIGGLGLAVSGIAIGLYASEEKSFFHQEDPDDPQTRELTTAGVFTLAGIAMVPWIIPAIATSARVGDSSTHVGEVDERTDAKWKACNVQPAPGVTVELVAMGRVDRGTTDASGRFEFEAELSDLAIASLDVEVEGISIPNNPIKKSAALKARINEIAVESAREARERAAEEKQARAAAREAIIAGEIETGRCTQRRHGKLQRALQDLKESLDSYGLTYEGREYFSLVGHSIVVATLEGTPLELSNWLGGEIHVFAVGFDGVDLEVTDPDGYHITAGSKFEPQATSHLSDHHDSRLLEAKSGAAYVLKAKGRGCVLVTAFRRL